MEDCRKWEHVRVNTGLAAGKPEWSPALVWGVGVGSAFDDRARFVWDKSQVFRCGADLILGNLGFYQGWGGERLPAVLQNASGGQAAKTHGHHSTKGKHCLGHSQARLLIWSPL